jgi:hypothetical protein
MKPSAPPSAGSAFRNAGTSQAERLPDELLPTGLQLDARSLDELLAYVARFSEMVRFYVNPEAPATSGWALAEHRSLLLLAEIAAQPVEQHARELTTQLAPLRDPAASARQRQHGRQRLLRLLRQQAATLSGWHAQHRSSNRQTGFTSALLSTLATMAPLLRRAARAEQWLLAESLIDSAPQLTDDFLQRFEHDLPTADDAADLTSIYRPGQRVEDNTEELIDLLWQLHRAQASMAQVAHRSLVRDLRVNPDHRPEIGLLVAFLKLYGYAQQELNDIPRRHLDYYYQQVLRVARRASVPDHAYLSFALAKGQTSYPVPAGTLVDGGKDEAGQRVLFATTADATVGSWRVAALATLLVDRAGRPATAKANAPGLVTAVRASAVGAPASPAGANWLEFAGPDATRGFADLALADAPVGFAVAAPVLRLAEGRRLINVRLTLGAQEFNTFRSRLYAMASQARRDSDALLYEAFTARITGPAGWLDLSVQSVTLNQADGTLDWTLLLERAAPAVTGYVRAAHGGRFETALPVLQMHLNPRAVVYAYSLFAELRPLSLRLQVAVRPVRQLLLSNQLGPLDASKPFFPLGAQARPGSYLLIDVPELLGKNLTQLTLALSWQNLPPDGFPAYYAGYGEDFSNDAFRVKVSYLSNYKWLPAAEQRPAQRLFGAPAATGPAASQTVLTLPSPGQLGAAPDGQGARLRVELSAPAAGFGADRYPAALAETVQYNAQHPKQPRPLPQPPFVPLLGGLSVGYQAEEILHPSTSRTTTAETSGFFHLHPFAEYRPEPYDNRLLPSLADEAAFYLGLEPAATGLPINLIFDLALPTEADAPAPPIPRWEYLFDDEWQPIAQSTVASEGQPPQAALVPGFANAHQLAFRLPDRLPSQQRCMPEGYWWLRASVPEGARLLGRLQALYPQLVPAVRVGEGPTPPAPYQQPLPAGRLTRLLKPLAGVAGVWQPRPSFGGRVAENQAAYYTRVSERLRHRGRALLPGDYERLLLEQFPDVYSAKCLTADQLPPPRRPGRVLLVVLPRPDLVPGNPLPLFGAGELAAMRDFLAPLAPAVVELVVQNPRYEQVQVRGTVAFQPGAPATALPQHLQLQHDVSAFISPWQPQQPHLGGFHRHITTSGLRSFISQLPYVAELAGFAVLKTAVFGSRHRLYDSALDAPATAEDIGRMEPWAVLVPAAQHDFSAAGQPLRHEEHEPPPPVGIGGLRIEDGFLVSCEF